MFMYRIVGLIGLFVGLFTSSFGQYCGTAGRCGDNIATVAFSNVTKSSGCGSNGYEFHNNDTVFVTIGEAYTIVINNSTYLDARVVGWIDYDQNEIFDETERMDFGTTTVAATHAATTTVPPTFPVGGITRARFTLYNTLEPVADACGNYVVTQSYEYEDYVIKSGAPSTSTYCTANGSNGVSSPNCNDAAATLDTHINGVQVVGEFNNQNGTCGITSGGYSDYTNIQAIIADGEDYTVNVALYSEGNAYESVRAWVDWNGDKVFDDVQEMLTVTNIPGDNNWVFTGTHTNEGYTGPVLLRVRGYWGYVEYVPSACGTNTYGEVEDYTIILTTANAPDCASTPSPADAATDLCLNGLDLSWAHADVANIDGFYLSLGTAPGTYELLDEFDVGTNISYSYPAELLANKTYYWKVEPYKGAEKAPACSEWSFTTSANADPKPSFYVGGDLTSDTSTCINEPLEIKVQMVGGDGTLAQGSWTASSAGFLGVIQNDSAVFEGSTAASVWVYHNIEDGNGCTGVDSIKVTVNPSPDTGQFNKGVQTFCGSGTETFEVLGTTGTIQWQDSLPGGLWNDIANETGTDYELSLNDQSGPLERYLRVVLTENGCTVESIATGMIINPNPQKPELSYPDGLFFCEGDSVTLKGAGADSLVWLPSEIEAIDDLVVKEAGDITLRLVNVQTGCYTDSTVTVEEEANPAKPILNPAVDQTVCSGSLPFAVSVTNPSASVLWMNAETTNDISLSATTAEIWVMNETPKGCSMSSDTISLTVVNQPDKPIIDVPSGSTDFCDGDSLFVRVTNYSADLTWSDNNTEVQRYIKSGGTYTVTFGDDPNCQAVSDPITVTMLPSPTPITLVQQGPNPGCVGDSVLLIATNYDEVSWNNSTNTINDTLIATTSGNYRATVEGTNGCTRSASIAVTLNDAPPEPSITISGQGDCPGQEKILIADTDVTWSDANNTFNDSLVITSSGTYTATVTVGVCSSSSSIDVVYAGAPEVPQITSSNDTLFVTPNDQPTYTWYLDGQEVATTTEPFYEFTEAGNYTVTYTTAGDCTSDISEVFVVVGLGELNPLSHLNIYPNPGTGIFYFTEKVDLVEVFDALGRKIQTSDRGRAIELIAPKGLYLIKLTKDRHHIERRIILE